MSKQHIKIQECLVIYITDPTPLTLFSSYLKLDVMLGVSEWV
jgi:hypothetical protein